MNRPTSARDSSVEASSNGSTPVRSQENTNRSDRLHLWLRRIRVQQQFDAVNGSETEPFPEESLATNNYSYAGSSSQQGRSPGLTSASSSGSPNSINRNSSDDYYNEYNESSGEEDNSEYSEGEFIISSSPRPRHSTSGSLRDATTSPASPGARGQSNCLSRSAGQSQRNEACFICRTTDMSSWVNDPQGRPICIVCGNLYYVRLCLPPIMNITLWIAHLLLLHLIRDIEETDITGKMPILIGGLRINR